MSEIEFLTAVRDALLPDQGERASLEFAEAQRVLNEALNRDVDKRWRKVNLYGTVRHNDIGGLALLSEGKKK